MFFIILKATSYINTAILENNLQSIKSVGFLRIDMIGLWRPLYAMVSQFHEKSM